MNKQAKRRLCLIALLSAASAIVVLLLIVGFGMRENRAHYLDFGLGANTASARPSSFTASVTNCAPWRMSLYQAELLLAHSGGEVTRSDAEAWNGANAFPVYLSPGAVATFPLQIATNVEGCRVSFQYGRDAGTLRKATSRGLRALKLRWPHRLSNWLAKHGLWDGQFSYLYESAWTGTKPITLSDNLRLPSAHSSNEIGH